MFASRPVGEFVTSMLHFTQYTLNMTTCHVVIHNKPVTLDVWKRAGTTKCTAARTKRRCQTTDVPEAEKYQFLDSRKNVVQLK